MVEDNSLDNLKLCECGCGNLMNIYDKRGRIRRFIYHHQPMTGDHNGQWKGGRTKISRGYIIVKARDHPNCNNQGYVLEHRLVMEKHLGRYLDKDEVVHHINGIVNDNRIENLSVMYQKEHIKIHIKYD